MVKLTKKQQRVYDFILTFTREHGYPPAVREIGDALGLKSPSTVHFHIKGLERAGAIGKDANKTRAITLPRGALDTDGQIPVVGHVAAGAPILATEHIEEYIPFEGGADEHFALRVRGESMIDIGIRPGDLVVVHRQQDVCNGDIVVALLEDEATVKTYRRHDDRVELLPHNPAFSPIDGTHAQMIGKVVALLRRY